MRVVAFGHAGGQFDLEGPDFRAGLGVVHVTAVAQLGGIHIVCAALAQVIEGHIVFVVYQALLPLAGVGRKVVAGRYALEAVAHKQAAAVGRELARGREDKRKTVPGDVADGNKSGVESAIHGDIGAGFGADAHPFAVIGVGGRRSLAHTADEEVVFGAGFEAGKGVGVAGVYGDGVGESRLVGHTFSGDGQFEPQGGRGGGIPSDAEALVGGGNEGKTVGLRAAGNRRVRRAGMRR